MHITSEPATARNNEPITLRKQLDPRWWVQVADNPTPPAHYRPDDAQRQRKWQARNFMHNFRRYVVGVTHKDRHAWGSFTRTGNALRQPSGLLWGVTLCPGRAWMGPLPYLSVRIRRPGAVYDLAVGWSRFGMLMFKARIMRPGAFDWE